MASICVKEDESSEPTTIDVSSSTGIRYNTGEAVVTVTDVPDSSTSEPRSVRDTEVVHVVVGTTKSDKEDSTSSLETNYRKTEEPSKQECAADTDSIVTDAVQIQEAYSEESRECTITGIDNDADTMKESNHRPVRNTFTEDEIPAERTKQSAEHGPISTPIAPGTGKKVPDKTDEGCMKDICTAIDNEKKITIKAGEYHVKDACTDNVTTTRNSDTDIIKGASMVVTNIINKIVGVDQSSAPTINSNLTNTKSAAEAPDDYCIIDIDPSVKQDIFIKEETGKDRLAGTNNAGAITATTIDKVYSEVRESVTSNVVDDVNSIPAVPRQTDPAGFYDTPASDRHTAEYSMCDATSTEDNINDSDIGEKEAPNKPPETSSSEIYFAENTHIGKTAAPIGRPMPECFVANDIGASGVYHCARTSSSEDEHGKRKLKLPFKDTFECKTSVSEAKTEVEQFVDEVNMNNDASTNKDVNRTKNSEIIPSTNTITWTDDIADGEGDENTCTTQESEKGGFRLKSLKKTVTDAAHIVVANVEDTINALTHHQANTTDVNREQQSTTCSKEMTGTQDLSNKHAVQAFSKRRLRQTYKTDHWELEDVVETLQHQTSMKLPNDATVKIQTFVDVYDSHSDEAREEARSVVSVSKFDMEYDIEVTRDRISCTKRRVQTRECK